MLKEGVLLRQVDKEIMTELYMERMEYVNKLLRNFKKYAGNFKLAWIGGSTIFS